ncbi:class I SAM-dependent methyltransferase [Streptantibioticus rubrisoli]|uniref:Class I SAM-dependent methyltransferase n=1 Tax=Streptantibioticus rubrisoli TaxID=1387313 RepID=A0ABT1P572_9ACTN|nr:class I SAM-dependent methyltransferase [Streptantibioticus rubrisoli]MCQ4040523.1 class I SAM-dependent methyltransferase [Streptantibioticus rubrisoli]
MNPETNGLNEFYSSPGTSGRTLFQTWELGEARGDSVTPSTYSSRYRDWMHDKLLRAIKDSETDRLLSLGSGNAAVESGIAQTGYRVLAVDAVQEAVDIAAAKGVEALRADVMTWSPEGRWPVVYADGLLGHLYAEGRGLAPVFERIHAWLTADGTRGTFIASNDSPPSAEPTQAAPGVPGFYWLSGEYLRGEALGAGFSAVEVQYFDYDRPLSGQRSRAVITATVGF